MSRLLSGLIFALIAALALPNASEAQSPYKLRTGDTLQLEVLEDSSLNRTLLVLPDGSVSVPLVGSLRASGRTLEDLRARVTAGLAPNFAAAPTVFISVDQIAERRARTPSAPATMSIFLIGEVATPGKVDVAPGTTLLQALATAGGLTRFGAEKRIQLHRDDGTGKQMVYGFNYKAAKSGASRSTIRLKEGDVIVVPVRKLFE